MLNFPVGAGTSGHLLGGALAAILVGPWTGVLCVTVVLLVQALLFADGGLTALGVNVTCMAVVAVVRRLGWSSGWLLRCCRRRGSRARRRRRRRAACRCRPRRWPSSGSTRVGGDRRHPARHGRRRDGRRARAHRDRRGGDHRRWWSSAVLAVRPDLVYGARDLRADARAAPGRSRAGAVSRACRPARWLLAGLLVALLLAGVGELLRQRPAPTGWRRSPRTRASSTPRGTPRPPTRRWRTTASRASTTRRLSGGLAGVIGVLSTLALAGGLTVAAAPCGAGRRGPAPDARRA